MSLLGRIAHRLGPAPLKANPARNLTCAEVEVDTSQVSAFVVDRLVPVVGVEPFPLNELMMLTSAVCWLSPTHIFEWGTHLGKSARAFYEVTRFYGIPSEIHSVDLPDDVEHVEHPHAERGRMVRGLERVHLHQGDGVTRSLEIWASVGRPEAPLFLIDGDHGEPSVYRELSAVADAVPAPVVLLHDTYRQSDASGYYTGPHRAIERVLRERPGRFKRLDSGLGLPGMTLLNPTPRDQS